MLIIEDKRAFIIGSYHLPKSEKPYRELSENGFNYVRISPDKESLDRANEYDLKTWISVGSIKEGSEEDDKKRITEIIKNFEIHPALLCWEMVDEPAFTWGSAEPRVQPQPLKLTYDFINSLDNEHMIFTNHAPTNLISTLQKYNNSTNIVGVDVYPVLPYGIEPTYALYPDGLQGDLLNPYISQVGEYIDKMKKVVLNSKPIFAVLQGFSWEMLKPKNERTESMIQYPTYDESRFMAYNAIVHGANGILYWGMSYTPQPSAFISDLYKVTNELSEMQNVLSETNSELRISKNYHELMYSVDTGVECIVKEVDDKLYLISVNSDKNPVKVTFTGLHKFSKAEVLKENRSLKILDGELTDTYKPFGVHVYKIYQ